MTARPQRIRRMGLGACLLLPALSLIAKEPVHGTHGMVIAQEPFAADAGLAVLRAGGNAIDAAVAVGFALAVTHPSAGNIGGGGFLLARLANGQTVFLDFREAAPGKASRDMYLGPDGKATEDSIYGWRSPGVPGTVAGFELATQRWGSRHWADLLAPAIALARDGFTVSPALSRSLASDTKFLQKDPESKRIFLHDGRGWQAGDKLRQPELAATLERIAHAGSKEFYRGETAHKLAAAMAAHGGLLSEADLAAYKVHQRPPLTGFYAGFQIITAPPPSAGGIGLLQVLGMLEGTGYWRQGANSPQAVHWEAEAMRRFYADRSEYLGDPDFYNVPLKPLLEPVYLARRRATIDPEHATPSEEVEPGLPRGNLAGGRPMMTARHESAETTHYNVVDAQGNAVAVTYTLNNSYGNGITAPGLGFLLNDEMDDFSAQPGVPNMFGLVGGEANAIEAGKRPLSSMTPTIVMQGGKFFAAIGAPGGSRITTGVTEVLLDVLDFHMNAQDAVDLPRFHEQWKPDVLYLTPSFPRQPAMVLERMGYVTKPIDSVARVELIVKRGSALEGGTESKLDGKVAAY